VIDCLVGQNILTLADRVVKATIASFFLMQPHYRGNTIDPAALD